MRRATVPFLVVLVLAGLLLAATVPDPTAARAAPAVQDRPSGRIARPGVYAFYDWQHLDPAQYPIKGGHITIQWKTLEPAAAFDWGPLEDFLARDAALGKVDGVGLDPYDGPCCGGTGVPRYLVARQPELEVACGSETIPAYWRPAFREAYGRFIAEFGRRFDGDPRIAFLEIGVGMFGETQPGPDEQNPCLEAAGLTSTAWLDYARWVIDAHAAAFTRTPLVLEYAPRYLYVCERRTLADYAAERGIGLQHSGLLPDGGGATVIDDASVDVAGCGQYDPMLAWQGHAALGWEGTEWADHKGPAATLWRIYNGLDKHPDFILLDTSQVTDPLRRSAIEFANAYAGRTLQDTPGVWAALRETEYDWFPQRGNYEFWLYQVYDAPNARTVPLWRVGDAPEGRYTRRTDEATGNRYMAFDVDDRYLYDVQTHPVTVTVTYLDQGLDTWAVEYDARGGIAATETVTKTDTGRWLTARFVLPDATFADGLPGGKGHRGSDLRIDSRGDGNEIVHLVLVQGDERPIPPDAAPTAAVTPAGTPTSEYMATPVPVDPKLTPTPVPPPMPAPMAAPNSASAYGSIE